jgi:hypothetical protein
MVIVPAAKLAGALGGEGFGVTLEAILEQVLS